MADGRHRLAADEITALADAFAPGPEAEALLARARFPRRAVPRNGTLNGLEYWSEVAEQVAAGIMADGRDAILAEARRVYPYNTIFARFPGLPGPADGKPQVQRPTMPDSRPEPANEPSKPPSATSRRRLWGRVRDTLSALSAVVGALASIVTIAALYVHGSTAILIWSVSVLIAAVIVVAVITWARGRTLRVPALAGIASALVLAGATAGGIVVYRDHPQAAPPGSGSSAGGTPTIRHQGILKLPGDDVTSFDLDSTAKNWGMAKGTWKYTWSNIQYIPYENGPPTLDIANAPAADVVLGTGGHWDYKTCADADYLSYGDPGLDRNDTVGINIDPGHGICVITFNNDPQKKDGGHVALLVVVSRTVAVLTLQVTVWKSGY